MEIFGFIGIKEQLTKARNDIASFLDKKRINALGKSTGFVKRIRKISPYMFFCLLGTREAPESLRKYSSRLCKDREVFISRQSIDDKFTKEGVEFMKQVLEEALEMLFYGKDDGAIKLKDSTSFQAPEAMYKDFKGSGGGGSKAGLKIQHEHGTDGHIFGVSVGPMAEPDSANIIAGNSKLGVGDLSIRDLGYVSVKAMEDVDSRDACYVYRLNSCNVYVKDDKGEYTKVDFGDLYKKYNKPGAREMEVYMGEKKYRTRLVFEPVPERVYEQRVRKRRAVSKKKGRNTSKENLQRQRFNLLITNTAIDAADLRKVYRLRWQVELVFKGWKSFERIALSGEVRQERVLMELYAKLAWIVVKTRLEMAMVQWGRKNDIPISAMKLRDDLSRYSSMLWDAGREFFPMMHKTWRQNLRNIIRETKKVDKVKFDWEKFLKKLEKAGIKKFVFK